MMIGSFRGDGVQRFNETLDQLFLDLFHRRSRIAEKLLNTGCGAAGQAAGDDQVEIAQVGGDVQGEAMQGGAAADADADGADFSEVGPDSDGAGFAAGGDCETLQRGDHRVFEGADVSADGQGVIVEADDGVDHDLAGAVKGDVAAAVAMDEIDAETLEVFGLGQKVLEALLAAADGDDGRVLEEEELFGIAGGDLLVEFFLQGPGLAIFERSQVDGFNHDRPNYRASRPGEARQGWIEAVVEVEIESREAEDIHVVQEENGQQEEPGEGAEGAKGGIFGPAAEGGGGQEI